MEDRYDCPHCSYTSTQPGLCPDCQVHLVATCPHCGNPLTGEVVAAESSAE